MRRLPWEEWCIRGSAKCPEGVSCVWPSRWTHPQNCLGFTCHARNGAPSQGSFAPDADTQKSSGHIETHWVPRVLRHALDHDPALENSHMLMSHNMLQHQTPPESHPLCPVRQWPFPHQPPIEDTSRDRHPAPPSPRALAHVFWVFLQQGGIFILEESEG